MSRVQQACVNFTANGQVGPWIFHDWYEAPFDLTLLISLGSGLAATLAIDYIADDFLEDGLRYVSISQATTVITVTDLGPTLGAGFGPNLGHGLAVGDAVSLKGTPGGSVDGVYAVATVTSATVYTLTALVSQTLATQLAQVTSGRFITAGATDKIIPLAAVTARTAVGVSWPIVASRLHVTAFTSSGVAALVAVQGGHPS